ncbi:MAG: hypothetical protein N4J56_007325 [Chroococcidiopsis sp. SAG 2025]|nr:hypothetical protein [Chroococcidiopsis sp. SAG 2025]
MKIGSGEIYMMTYATVTTTIEILESEQESYTQPQQKQSPLGFVWRSLAGMLYR